MRTIRIDADGCVVIVSGLGAGQMMVCPHRNDGCSTDCALMVQVNATLECRAQHYNVALGELEELEEIEAPKVVEEG